MCRRNRNAINVKDEGGARPAPKDAVNPSMGARLRPSWPQTPLGRVSDCPLAANQNA